MAGLLLHTVPPKYPKEARAAHIAGDVILHAIVSKTGSIRDLTVISGPPELRKAAMDAVSQWRYKPYLLNNEIVEVETSIAINFGFTSDPLPSKALQRKQP